MKKASLTIVFLLVGLYAIQAQSLYVSSMKGNVNVRTAPSTAAAKIGTLAATVLVPCIEELDGWYKIEFNGKEGYVAQAVATTCEANIPLEMFGKSSHHQSHWTRYATKAPSASTKSTILMS